MTELNAHDAMLRDLRDLDACSEGVEWASAQPDLATAWAKCERADWMLWLAARKLPRQIVVQAACDCAEISLHLITDGGLQMLAILVLHIAREWAEGREDLETVRGAVYAATDAAADCAAADCAAYAAYAAAYAATYADADVAATYADDAACAVADATVADAAYAAARNKALRSMTDLVRVRIPVAPGENKE